MRRTSTLRAAAAALGLLAGFVMAPEGRAPLDRDVTPYAVAVAWRAGGPPELPSVAGVEVDDWGGRITPTPARRRVAPEPRVRAPAAPPEGAAPAEVLSGKALRPLILRDDVVGAAFDAPRRGCPREDAAAREAQAEAARRHHTRAS